MIRIRSLVDSVYFRILSFVSTNAFFYTVVFICIAQALWFAFSFVPWINDEARHYGNIVVYASHLSPFLGKQLPTWDYLGAITHSGSFMFYYLMSWPLRLIRVFTTDTMAQIIGLRCVCIAMFAVSLFIIRKALFEIATLPRSVVNVLLLFFVTIPAFAVVPATINYDDMVFLLFSFAFLLAVRIVKTKHMLALPLLVVISLGLLMCLVKWTSLGLFAPLALYVGYDQYKKFGADVVHKFALSIKKANRLSTGVTGAALIILMGLFIARPVANLVQYHTLEPSCPSIIGIERCKKFPDYVAYAALTAEKPADFKPVDPIKYLAKYWLPKMLDTADNLLERGTATELPTMIELYGLLVLIGTVISLVYLRELWSPRLHKFLFLLVALYLFSLLLDEYDAYMKYGVPAAIRARYLLPISPILLYLVVYACIGLWAKYKKLLLAGAIVILIVSTQGGGIITYLLTSPQNAYWNNSPIESANEWIRGALRPFVRG